MKGKTSFNCTQQELYLAVPIAWVLCRSQLLRFAKLKGFYTEGYINDRLAEVVAAKAIPNFNVRKDEPSTHRVYLDEAIEDCCHYFLMLKSLIVTAFRPELLEGKYKAAGSPFFNKAEQGNEGAMNDLNESAIQFIQNNEADLKADNNMTDSFLADYQAVVANYNTYRKAYNESSKTATGLTQNNKEANINLHKTMMAMFADARVIFRKEPELRDRFTFTAVLDQVVSASVAGIRGKVTNAETEKGIEKVKIVIEGKEKTYETDKLGKFDIAQLANGVYRITFSCKGYKDVISEEFEVKTGVYNTLNVEMEPVEVGVLVAA